MNKLLIGAIAALYLLGLKGILDSDASDYGHRPSPFGHNYLLWPWYVACTIRDLWEKDE